MAVLTAIFISNVPEGLSSSAGLAAVPGTDEARSSAPGSSWSSSAAWWPRSATRALGGAGGDVTAFIEASPRAPYPDDARRRHDPRRVRGRRQVAWGRHRGRLRWSLRCSLSAPDLERASPGPVPSRHDPDDRRSSEARARDILRDAPLIDGHNDLAYALREKVGLRTSTVDLREPQPELDTDIPRLRLGAVGGQFWSVWVPVPRSRSRRRSASRSSRWTSCTASSSATRRPSRSRPRPTRWRRPSRAAGSRRCWVTSRAAA